MTRLARRSAYLRRVFASYVFTKNNQLTFWHETPERNPQARPEELGPYWMRFAGKTNYPGPFDDGGIPLLDYHGEVGRHHNPIAIAQYALGNYNAFLEHGRARHRDAFERSARWLLENLRPNERGVPVWAHHFDFEYFQTLRAPWHSGLAQGVGLSVMHRAHRLLGDAAYLEAAHRAYASLHVPTDRGGVLYVDPAGDPWIEEYIVEPPTHILNGFLWALWGVHDHRLATADAAVRDFFEACVSTVIRNLDRYDTGFWSLYELTPQRFQSPASPYYHRLHLVQLDIMHRLTGRPEFEATRARWTDYASRRTHRSAAWVTKAAFKLAYW